MAKLTEKYQRAYLREYAKEADQNARVWMDTDDYLAECLDTQTQCHKDASLQEQIRLWLFMLRINHNPDLLGYKTAILANDMALLHAALRQSAMIKHTTLGVDSGCDHSINIWTTLDILAAGLFARVPLLLPEKWGLSDNGHPVTIAIANLVMALWYKRTDFAAEASKRAQKVLATKQAASDVCILRYLMALLEEDVTEAGVQLDLYCKSVPKLRDAGLTKLNKMFWPYAHGLYNLASAVWGSEKASTMSKPEADCFLDDLAEWQIQHNYHPGALFFEYPQPIDVINTLISCTPPECVLHQPYLETDKKYREKRYLHSEMFEQQMIAIVLNEIASKTHRT